MINMAQSNATIIHICHIYIYIYILYIYIINLQILSISGQNVMYPFFFRKCLVSSSNV